MVKKILPVNHVNKRKKKTILKTYIRKYLSFEKKIFFFNLKTISLISKKLNLTACFSFNI